MLNVGAWLAEVGLPQYAEAFEREAIDDAVLPTLTDADLRELGVATLGHRKRLLAAVAALNGAAASRPVSDDRPAPAPVSPAERRQLTVLFCDLSGSTQLSQRLDPESLRTLLESYQRACRAVVERYEGFVAQYLGDGIMAYFGWPRAHEDDAERALRAGLELLGAVKSVDAPTPLQVRIGVASGAVVVGEGSEDPSSPKLAVGETPNIAARLQGLAGLDEIVIAPSTKQLAEGVFRFADLGAQQLKGIVEPVHAWRVEALSEAQGRFEARSLHLTPLVGRQDEVELLKKRWAQAVGGDGQVVLISGEPGIGKSRLTQVLSDHVSQSPPTRLRYQCSPYHVNSAFYPIVEQLTRAARLSAGDSAQSKLKKLEASLAQARSAHPHGTQLIAALLGIPSEYPALTYTPQKHKDETIKALAAQATGLASQAPVLMILEDAHWSDPSSLEAFEQLIQAIPGQRILLVITYRPEFAPKWVGQSHVTLIALSRLDRRHAALLASRVAEGRKLPPGVLEQIQARTDGIPLFLEELTKAVLETGLDAAVGAPAGASAIPATLRDSLMARLDRLGPAKEIAQVAACIGREFDYRLLAAVAQMDAAKLDAALDQLIGAELVFKRGERPEASFQFKHALVQDAAYDSLLKAARARLHGRIAEALEQDPSRLPDARAEILARHFSAADMPVRAAQNWIQAGKRACEEGRCAYQEALAHYDRALKELGCIPPSPERDELELSVRTEAGLSWVNFAGWSHPNVYEQLGAAWALAEKANRPDVRAFRIRIGLLSYRMCKGHIRASLDSDLEDMAARLGDESLMLSALACRAGSLFYLGDYQGVIAMWETIATRYDQERDRGAAGLHGVDPLTHGGAFAAFARWALGYPDQARGAQEYVIEHAVALGRPYNLAWGLIHCGYTLAEQGSSDGYRAHLDRAERIAREQGIDFMADVWLPAARLRLLCLEGDDTGVASIFPAVKQAWIRSGLMIGLPWITASPATALVRLGRPQEALSLLDESLAQIRTPGWEERSYLAEVLRVRAAALLALGRKSEAEVDLQASLEVAREQEAKSLELRAAMDYARFMHARGRTGEALTLLRPVYDWFTEGFDTRDLIEAKVLLDELGS